MLSLFRLNRSATRNLAVLFVCVSVALAGAPIVVLAGGLVGQALAPSASLATLPIASLIVGTAAASVPAALLMQRVGRRFGYALGALLGVLACAVTAWAVSASNFAGFVTGTLLIGASLAFVQQYRFAAVESVPAAFAGQAVSVVMLGGVVSGFVGPELFRWTRDWLPAEYAGSFYALGAIYALVALIMLLGLRDIMVAAPATAGAGRSVRVLAAQPMYRAAVMAAATASGVMVLIMTATPISMHVHDGHSVDATAAVIRSHMIAMFLPSVVSGFLVARVGPTWLIRTGMFALAATVASALISRTLLSYWSALVLLGIGWNLLFLAATVQLTRSYRPEERFRAQALNDFTVFSAQAVAALAAGSVLYRGGWNAINLLALAAMVPLFITMRTATGRTSVAAQAGAVASATESEGHA